MYVGSTLSLRNPQFITSSFHRVVEIFDGHENMQLHKSKKVLVLEIYDAQGSSRHPPNCKNFLNG
jgi:hypothetical protein